MNFIKYEVSYPEELTEKFNKISKSDDMLFFIANICCYSICLYHIKKQKYVSILLPVLKGKNSGNRLLTLKLEINEEATVKEMLVYIRSKVIECYNNNFDTNLNNERCRYIISYDRIHNEINLCEHSNYICLSIINENGKNRGELYQSETYYSDFVYTDLAERYAALCMNAFDNIDGKVKDLEIYTKEELSGFSQRLTGKRTDAYLTFDICTNIQQLSQKMPDKVAVVADGSRYTYRDLWLGICQIASILKTKTDVDIVAIWGRYDFNMIAATFAVLAVNKTYFPIDCSMPYQRMVKALKLLDCKLILEYGEEAIDGVEAIMLDSILPDKIEFEYTGEADANRVAYVMFTSGTTGEPKAIPVKYSSLANYIYWKKDLYQYDENSTSLQVLSYNFDAFGSNLYPVLAFGGKMVMPARTEQIDFSKVAEIIVQEEVNEFNVVPSYYMRLLSFCNGNELDNVKRVILGGESASPEVIRMSKEKSDVELVNEYGPTETTITTTYMRDMAMDNIYVIGKVINNNKVYVVNEEGKNLYPGIPGELCVCGVGVMDGYLYETDRESFINMNGDKAYKTGDIVRYNKYGELEYLRRKNNQVTLNGYRIDLEEIGNCIIKSGMVDDSTVVVRSDRYGNKYLSAFIVKKEGKSISIDDMVGYMKENFAEYMMPKQYVWIEAIPRSVNGKKDRKILEEIQIDEKNILSKQNIEPQTETEKKMYDIWSDLLGLERISCVDNFFYIGGNSLLVMELQNIVNEQFDVHISITDYFNYYTIKSLSAHIDLVKEESRR